MNISEKEIREDFARFIRHEAMRANCSQEEIRQIIYGEIPTVRAVAGHFSSSGVCDYVIESEKKVLREGQLLRITYKKLNNPKCNFE